jgi:uncharacterized protein (DUF2252 family)
MKKSTRAVSPKNRAAVLESSRRRKMARSAHAYVRGNTLKFYEWLNAGNGRNLPQGPPIWICGDCHVGNLGPVASADGRVEIEIRDLDQTVIGNPAHDLIRLGLSLATAARGSASRHARTSPPASSPAPALCRRISANACWPRRCWAAP